MTLITPPAGMFACDAPGCGEPWKWHDPATGLRYCDPCAALGWGHCTTRCADAKNTPPRRLYATDNLGEYTALFRHLDREYGPIARGQIIHDDPAPAPLGELDETTEAAMTRFDAAHNAEPSDGGGE